MSTWVGTQGTAIYFSITKKEKQKPKLCFYPKMTLDEIISPKLTLTMYNIVQCCPCSSKLNQDQRPCWAGMRATTYHTRNWSAPGWPPTVVPKEDFAGCREEHGQQRPHNLVLSTRGGNNANLWHTAWNMMQSFKMIWSENVSLHLIIYSTCWFSKVPVMYQALC